MILAILLPLAVATDVSGVVSLSNGRPAVGAVVFLNGEAKSTPLKKVVVDQRDMKFVPHVSVVTKGTRVDFPNNDVVFHNVFSEYNSSRFDLGMYPRGAKKQITFDKPGLAVILCSVHPEMGAFVMCVDTPYYAITDRRGRFTIRGVAAGSYEFRAWHETGEKHQKPLTIGSSKVDLVIKTEK